jgi:hypothetical protein
VSRRGASRGPVRHYRPVARRSCGGQAPAPVFASQTSSATSDLRPNSRDGAHTTQIRRNNCSADARRSAGLSPNGVWAHPAGRGEATGLMPRPLQNQSPTRVVDAMTGAQLRRPASIPAQLRAEVSARHQPPFQRLRYPTAPCPLRFLASDGRPMKPPLSTVKSDRP